MELYLIRHAQSQNNALPEERRIEDPGLTDLGRRQAELLANWIPQLGLTRIVCSPFLRALETARPIHAATGLDAEVRTAIHEQGGCYRGYPAIGMTGRPGLSRLEIETRFPGFRVADEIDGNGWWRCQTYETRALAQQRAAAVLRQTRDEFAHTSERLAYITHADFKLLFLEHFHREPLEIPHNTSVSRVLVTSDEIRLVGHNGVEHLPAELLSR